MRELDEVIDDLPFPHRAASGRLLPTQQNVETLINAFGGVVAQAPGSRQLVVFFPGRKNATTPDCQLLRMKDICSRHELKIGEQLLTRYLLLIYAEKGGE